jgi:hypothetical protein
VVLGDNQQTAGLPTTKQECPTAPEKCCCVEKKQKQPSVGKSTLTDEKIIFEHKHFTKG